MYATIDKIQKHITLTEAAAAQAIGDPKLVDDLAKSALAALKANNDGDIADLQMAVVTQQVRSHVDAQLISKKIQASKTQLNGVVKKVVDKIASSM